jgi:hypothetical protein
MYDILDALNSIIILNYARVLFLCNILFINKLCIDNYFNTLSVAFLFLVTNIILFLTL